MMSPYLRVLQALGTRVGRKQAGGVMAMCPCHQDDKHSLSVLQKDDHCTLKCFAGCTAVEICDAIGLKTRDLYPSKESSYKIQISEIYRYEDEAGKLLYEVVRLVPKSFRQRVPIDGTNGYRWSIGDIRRVLYRLPELSRDSNRVVFLCEGEKDAKNLAALGLLTTTKAGGAASPWLMSYTEALRGRHVICLPDNDEPGFACMQQAADALHGIAASVRIVALPGLKPKGDVSAWLAAGGTRADLKELVRAVEPEKNVMDMLISLDRRIRILETRSRETK